MFMCFLVSATLASKAEYLLLPLDATLSIEASDP